MPLVPLTTPFGQGNESDLLENLEVPGVWSCDLRSVLAKVGMTMASFQSA